MGVVIHGNRDDLIAVDRHANGLAHIDIVERGDGGVQPEVNGGANAALDAAGLTKDGDTRTANGEAMEYELYVVTGWSDWVASCEIMAQNLAEVGIKATVTPLDYNAWYDKVTKGDFKMSIGWSDGGATPYSFYLGCMSTSTVKPVGTLSPQNWQRFGSQKADALLTQMAATSDLKEQEEDDRCATPGALQR